MRKILYCASTISHIRNFHLPYLKEFHDRGYEVWVVTNELGTIPYADHVVALPFVKKLSSLQNVKALLGVRKLLKQEDFDIISTHTPLASAVVRAAVLTLHKRPKVFYTAHGYLFNENDGLKKWIYLLPEKICAHVTDVLMVMNHEDYEIAQHHKLYREKIVYTHGMGIDLDRFRPATSEEKYRTRSKLGFLNDDFLFIYAAEFLKRKNQTFLIHSFAETCRKYPNMKLLLAGNGILLKECKELVKQLGAEKQIRFLGYVSDMRELYIACDVCVSASKIEGLPFNIMEAIACGLPVLASDIKGHRELVKDGETGWLFKPGDSVDLQKKLNLIYTKTDLFKRETWRSREIIKSYGLSKVFYEILQVYNDNRQIERNPQLAKVAHYNS